MKHDYTDEEIKTAWKDSLSLRAFLDALPERPQAAEIAKLKAEREKWEADALRYCKNADFWRSEHDKAQAVAAVVLAQAVRRMEAVVLAQAVRRMEAVSANEMWKTFRRTNSLKAVRAHLIAAFKGEGQVQPVVVNEPPQDEGQPDLSGESEKQTEPAWIPHDGGPCPLKDEEVELVEVKWYGSEKPLIAALNCISGWILEKGRSPKLNLITHYRVLKWKPGFGPEAKAGPAQPTTSPGWTPAVGDTVRLKSGGPVMTVTHVDPLSLMCAWMNASNELQVEPITTLCLTPAQP